VVSVTGWTWDYCEDELTMDRIGALQQEWMEHPPVGDLLAAFMGFKYEKPKGIEEFMEMITGLSPDGVLRLPAGA